MKWEVTWWVKNGADIYKNLETGELSTRSDLPIAACFAVEQSRHGYDGKSIVCKLPSGKFWYIDERASNCTKKDDNEHRCWVRHGTIGDKLTIDKRGNTCNIGAGSIRDINSEGKEIFHGFLRNGVLTDSVK